MSILNIQCSVQFVVLVLLYWTACLLCQQFVWLPVLSFQLHPWGLTWRKKSTLLVHAILALQITYSVLQCYSVINHSVARSMAIILFHIIMFSLKSYFPCTCAVCVYICLVDGAKLSFCPEQIFQGRPLISSGSYISLHQIMASQLVLIHSEHHCQPSL